LKRRSVRLSYVPVRSQRLTSGPSIAYSKGAFLKYASAIEATAQ
jgi:hypothetical protein